MASVPRGEHAFGPLRDRYVRVTAGRRRFARMMELAERFRQLAGVTHVQQWMIWAGWSLHVGCDRCADRAGAALCWGVSGCHGYEHGCGCAGCRARQDQDAAAAGAGR